MSDYNDLVKGMVQQMETIIGPVAIRQANQISGLETNGETIIKGNPARIVKQLIEKYMVITGPVALTLAKKAARPILKKDPKLKVPDLLKGGENEKRC